MQEQTYLLFHPTRLAFMKWYLLAFIIIGIGIFITLNAFEIVKIITITKDYSFYTVFIPFLGIIFILIPELLRNEKTYFITSNRIKEKRGIINIKENSIEWENVAHFTFSQNFIERLIDIGTINLYSLGTKEEKAEIVVKRVPNSKKIKFLLEKLISKYGKVGPVV